jgi:hypothetical protein
LAAAGNASGDSNADDFAAPTAGLTAQSLKLMTRNRLRGYTV